MLLCEHLSSKVQKSYIKWSYHSNALCFLRSFVFHMSTGLTIIHYRAVTSVGTSVVVLICPCIIIVSSVIVSSHLVFSFSKQQSFSVILAFALCVQNNFICCHQSGFISASIDLFLQSKTWGEYYYHISVSRTAYLFLLLA